MGVLLVVKIQAKSTAGCAVGGAANAQLHDAAFQQGRVGQLVESRAGMLPVFPGYTKCLRKLCQHRVFGVFSFSKHGITPLSFGILHGWKGFNPPLTTGDFYRYFLPLSGYTEISRQGRKERKIPGAAGRSLRIIRLRLLFLLFYTILNMYVQN